MILDTINEDFPEDIDWEIFAELDIMDNEERENDHVQI